MNSKAKDLVIVHPGTGTVIALSDLVVLVEADLVLDEDGEVDADEATRIGIRLDNFNMTNLFFGGHA